MTGGARSCVATGSSVADPDVQDLVEKMQALEAPGDPERSHGDADDLLVEAVRRLGAGDLADSFERVPKWYA